MLLNKHYSLFRPESLSGAVAIAGVGALGSALALQLAKLGLEQIVLYDDDVVAEHNIPNQILYGPQDVGQLKVECAVRTLQTLTGCTSLAPVAARLSKRAQLRERGVEYLFVAVDSMAARRQIFEQCVQLNPTLRYYNEARMNARAGSVYAFDPRVAKTAAAYHTDCLYSDEEVSVQRGSCGNVLSIGATAATLANQMCWHLLNTYGTAPQPIWEELSFAADNLTVHHKGLLAG